MDEVQAYGSTFSVQLRASSSYTELNATYQPIRNIIDIFLVVWSIENQPNRVT